MGEIPVAKTGCIFLVHGFHGGTGTWGRLPEFLQSEPALASYIVRTWTYPSSLSLKYMAGGYLWSDDPPIETIGTGFRTELDLLDPRIERIVLVGHSMGGLVIQAFILEELATGRRQHLDRLTEVILFGTPSAGLRKASWFRFLHSQVGDMASNAEFIEKLRSGWRQYIDEHRADGTVPGFRLTVVAGFQDIFVPRESSLAPFPFDDRDIVPGDHVTMVKPESPDDVVCRLLRHRLTRGTPTPAERRLMLGQAPDTVRLMTQVAAAGQLQDTAALLKIAADLEASSVPMPRVLRELGLALLNCGVYAEAIACLERYRAFKMPDGSTPFRDELEVRQQLAIALSGANRVTEAIALLVEPGPNLDGRTESHGILAGRLKRHWLSHPQMIEVGFRARRLYREAFRRAQETGDLAQVLYNGINAAYMDFATGGSEYRPIAEEVGKIADKYEPRDFWADATRAEALLLLNDSRAAEQAYRRALEHGPSRRAWASTAVQGLDILTRLGNPAGSERITALLRTASPDP